MPRLACLLVAAAAALPSSPGLSQGAITETRYATAGGWTVVRSVIGGRVDYCAATRSQGARAMRISWDGSAWIFAMNDARAASDFTAMMKIDDMEYSVSGESDGSWSYVTLPPDALEAFRAGRVAVLDTDGDPVEISLEGTAAATAKIRECATT